MTRPADRVMIFLGLGALACCGCFVDAAWLRRAAVDTDAERLQMVAQLRLTDLALFTETRYTRHPSQADLHSAFQDHPLAPEHFPTGSLIGPPAGLQKVGAGETAP